jgi:glycerol kinase
MAEPLLLGVDEGTTGVKAALFDRELRPVGEARRDKVNRHPRPGWVEQDGEEVLTAVVEAIGEMLRDAPGEVVACGLDHQGESVVAWDAASGEPLTPIVVWQDKRSQAVLDRLADREDEVKAASGLPFDPYFSAAKLAWLLEHDAAVARAREAGTLRMGTVDSFLCDRLGAGFATDPSTGSRTQLQRIDAAGWDATLCEIFGVPPEVLPEMRDTAGELGVLSHPSWPAELRLCAQTVDQQAALAGAGAVVPGRVKATYGTGVFVLAHVGDEVPRPAGGLLPTIAWRIEGRIEYALDGGVFAAGAMLEWLCRELGLAADPAELGELARSAEDSASARVLPALAGIGAPWWRPNARAVLAGLDGGTTRAQVARAAFEGIAWRVADVVAAIRESVAVESLRVDGGLTNEPLMLELQADAIGATVEAAAADATVLGAAALAAVGSGTVPSLLEAAELLPVQRRVEPGRDADWRTAEHQRWHEFVAATATLDER